MPNYGVLIPALISHGVDQLSEHCALTPGIPLKPMLAHPTKGVQEVLKRFESAKFTCEWKYDGERAQIHVLEGGETRVYSRNSENNTSKYPDIIARMSKVINYCTHVWGFHIFYIKSIDSSNILNASWEINFIINFCNPISNSLSASETQKKKW